MFDKLVKKYSKVHDEIYNQGQRGVPAPSHTDEQLSGAAFVEAVNKYQGEGGHGGKTAMFSMAMSEAKGLLSKRHQAKSGDSSREAGEEEASADPLAAMGGMDSIKKMIETFIAQYFLSKELGKFGLQGEQADAVTGMVTEAIQTHGTGQGGFTGLVGNLMGAFGGGAIPGGGGEEEGSGGEEAAAPATSAAPPPPAPTS